MNRQVLVSFSLQQLQRFQANSKKRVQEMRELMVELQRENKNLSIEYESLVQKKKQLHDKFKQKESGLMKIYSKSKEKMGNIIDLFKKDGRAYHPKVSQQSPTQQQKTKWQDEQQVKKKRITKDNFQFDDLYALSKEKVQSIVQSGSFKLQELSETIKQKYNSFSNSKQHNKEQEKQISHFSAEQDKTGSKHYDQLSQKVKDHS